MLKVAFVSTMEGTAWGGSEELWSQAALHLLAAGIQVAANLKGWPRPISQLDILETAGCKITRRSDQISLHDRIARRLRKGGIDVYKWLDEIKPDLVVISQGDHSTGVPWADQCLQRNLPYVLVSQAVNEHWWPEDETAMHIAAVYEKAKASFFVSHGNLELARKQFGTNLAKAQVIRNPFMVSYDASPQWPSEDSGYRLACVGRLEPKAKGQDILFEVLAEEKWRKRPLVVTLFGQGPNCRTLQILKDRYSLENVAFGGYVANVEDIWASNQGLILPSRYEGLPLAVVEAMLCSRLCIVTDVAGNRELVEDGVSGFIADAPVPICLDRAMERAWERRTEWYGMGQSARQRVQEIIPCDPSDVFANILVQLAQ